MHAQVWILNIIIIIIVVYEYAWAIICLKTHPKQQWLIFQQTLEENQNKSDTWLEHPYSLNSAARAECDTRKVNF